MRDINWNALFAFWVVAQHGSFAEAARALPRGSAQSLHKRVRELERRQDLALELLRSRGMKGVELTEAGRRVFQFIDPFFRGMDRLVSETQTDGSGSLSIGMSPFGAEDLAFLLIREFRGAFPKVMVTVRNGVSSEVVEMVLSGEVDVGICTVPEERAGLVLTGRVPVPCQLLVRSDGPTHSGFRSWEELLENPLVLPCRGSVLREHFERLLARRRLSRKLWVAAEVTSAQQIIDAVRSGIGIGLAPDLPQPSGNRRGVLRLSPPEGLPPMAIGVVRKARGHLPSHVRAFLHFAAAVIPDTLVAGALTSEQVPPVPPRARAGGR